MCDESFGMVSVLVTSPHTVHSLCLEPLSPQVESLSIIQSDEVCESTLIVDVVSISPHTVHSLCLEPSDVQVGYTSTIHLELL